MKNTNPKLRYLMDYMNSSKYITFGHGTHEDVSSVYTEVNESEGKMCK